MSPVQSPQIAVPKVTTRPQNTFLTSSFPHTHPNLRQNYTRVHPHISWGNPHTPSSPSHIRVVFKKFNTLNRDHFTCFSYLNKLIILQPHIVGLAETNLNWSHFPPRHQSTHLSKQDGHISKLPQPTSKELFLTVPLHKQGAASSLFQAGPVDKFTTHSQIPWAGGAPKHYRAN
jgi:hypothetical protein